MMAASAESGPAVTPRLPPRRVLRYALRAGRVLAVLFLTNAVLNLACGVAGRATPAVLFDGLVHGDIRGIWWSLASPGAGLAAMRHWAPSAAVTLWACYALLATGVLCLRPVAIGGLVLGAFLLVLTLRVTGADLWSDLATAKPLLLVLGLLLYGTALLLTVVRWQWLLAVQGVQVPFGALLRLSLIGVFFNLAIPGAVSGDLVKMGYIAAHAGERKAESMLTILVDRVVGVMGLLIVAAVSVACALPLLWGLDERYQPLRVAALSVALGSVVGVIGVILVEFRAPLVRQPGVSWLLARLGELLPAKLRDLVARLVTALDLYRYHRGTMLKATVLAVAVHTLLAIDLYALGKAVGESSLGLHHYVIAASVANAVASIPATPGGVGLRDKTAAIFLVAFGATPVEKAGSIPVILSLVIVFWALVGAAVFVSMPRRGTT
jgi:uncharacterized protein (TIRG00374 family)